MVQAVWQIAVYHLATVLAVSKYILALLSDSVELTLDFRSLMSTFGNRHRLLSNSSQFRLFIFFRDLLNLVLKQHLIHLDLPGRIFGCCVANIVAGTIN